MLTFQLLMSTGQGAQHLNSFVLFREQLLLVFGESVNQLAQFGIHFSFQIFNVVSWVMLDRGFLNFWSWFGLLGSSFLEPNVNHGSFRIVLCEVTVVNVI